MCIDFDSETPNECINFVVKKLLAGNWHFSLLIQPIPSNFPDVLFQMLHRYIPLSNQQVLSINEYHLRQLIDAIYVFFSQLN